MFIFYMEIFHKQPGGNGKNITVNLNKENHKEVQISLCFFQSISTVKMNFFLRKQVNFLFTWSKSRNTSNKLDKLYSIRNRTWSCMTLLFTPFCQYILKTEESWVLTLKNMFDFPIKNKKFHFQWFLSCVNIEANWCYSIGQRKWDQKWAQIC